MPVGCNRAWAGTAVLLVALGCERARPAQPSTRLAESKPQRHAPVTPLSPPEQVLARSDLAAYHGLVKYLQFRAEHAHARAPSDPGAQAEAERRLLDLSQRILDNPKLLAELRGIHEWAYLSPVDGSGQPFKLNIPSDYDPKKPTPLALLMHGYSGNHLEHTLDMQPHPSYFEAAVLGRTRGAGFRGLGEADVRQVLGYLEQHFNIDRRRVHLGGGSMGGDGAYWLAARTPHRFASLRVACGWASDKPLGNLLTVPVYALHSDDDFNVPVLHSRGPLAWLQKFGAPVVYEEVTGYGHGVWLFAEGVARATQWFQQQTAPNSKEVTALDFTALDGDARRSFWAEVHEWGPEPKPARFVLKAAPGNLLKATLHNIQRLRLELRQAPFDPSAKLAVEIGGSIVAELEPPLPAVAYLEHTGAEWRLHTRVPEAPFRLHTPGGANQLYNGEPLLIVYGTRGTQAEQHAMRDAAEAARRSSTARWEVPSTDRGSDGVPHNQNLYGELETKSDIEVNADDIARKHLVLIGTASQNAVVARLSARLPVAVNPDGVTFSDGVAVPGSDRALGLLHYNPEAPSRLLFWVAAQDASAYAAGFLIPELMARPIGADAIVTRISTPTLVMTRSFDSRWRWTNTGSTAPIDTAIDTRQELEASIAAAIRQLTHAPFALAGWSFPSGSLPHLAGTTRLRDLVPLFYYEPIGVMELSGKELLAAERALRQRSGPRLVPAPDPGVIDPARTYSVAVIWEQLFAFGEITRLAPKSYRVEGQSVADALERFGI